jgi:arginyl-tRNA--protein-N-Asp/Glu arginylyltransferase
MKLYFDHICGKQADTDFIHTLVSATVDRGEEQEALDNGWCPSNIWYKQDTNFVKKHKIIWYQSRQTRLNLSKYKETKNERKAWKKVARGGIEVEITTNPNFIKLYKIYKNYIRYKNFSSVLSQKEFIDAYECGNDIFLIYGDVAFSVVQKVGQSLLSHQFCWGYEDKVLGLGRFSTYREISLAKDLGLKYLYLGPSYENHGKYKSSFPGFEFWTGRKWCSDESKYFYLLNQDEEINSVEDLTDSYDSFFDSFSV